MGKMTHPIGKNTLGFILVYCLFLRLQMVCLSLYTCVLTWQERREKVVDGLSVKFWKNQNKNLMLYPDVSQTSLLLSHGKHTSSVDSGWPVINNARFTHFIGLFRKINPRTQIYCSLKCMDQLICIVYSWVLIRFETDALYYDTMRE